MNSEVCAVVAALIQDAINGSVNEDVVFYMRHHTVGDDNEWCPNCLKVTGQELLMRLLLETAEVEQDLPENLDLPPMCGVYRSYSSLRLEDQPVSIQSLLQAHVLACKQCQKWQREMALIGVGIGIPSLQHKRVFPIAPLIIVLLIILGVAFFLFLLLHR